MRVAQATPPAPVSLQASRLRYATKEVPSGDAPKEVPSGDALEEAPLGDDCIAMTMTYLSFENAILL